MSTQRNLRHLLRIQIASNHTSGTQSNAASLPARLPRHLADDLGLQALDTYTLIEHGSAYPCAFKDAVKGLIYAPLRSGTTMAMNDACFQGDILAAYDRHLR